MKSNALTVTFKALHDLVFLYLPVILKAAPSHSLSSNLISVPQKFIFFPYDSFSTHRRYSTSNSLRWLLLLLQINLNVVPKCGLHQCDKKKKVSLLFSHYSIQLIAFITYSQIAIHIFIFSLCIFFYYTINFMRAEITKFKHHWGHTKCKELWQATTAVTKSKSKWKEFSSQNVIF